VFKDEPRVAFGLIVWRWHMPRAIGPMRQADFVKHRSSSAPLLESTRPSSALAGSRYAISQSSFVKIPEKRLEENTFESVFLSTIDQRHSPTPTR